MKAALKAFYVVVSLQIFNATAALTSEPDSPPLGFSPPPPASNTDVTAGLVSGLALIGPPSTSVGDAVQTVGTGLLSEAVSGDAKALTAPMAVMLGAIATTTSNGRDAVAKAIENQMGKGLFK